MEELSQFVAEVFGIERHLVSAETGPGSVPQWDSLGHMHLVVAIEETYEVKFTTEEILSALSVGHIATMLEGKGVRVG